MDIAKHCYISIMLLSIHLSEFFLSMNIVCIQSDLLKYVFLECRIFHMRLVNRKISQYNAEIVPAHI